MIQRRFLAMLIVFSFIFSSLLLKISYASNEGGWKYKTDINFENLEDLTDLQKRILYNAMSGGDGKSSGQSVVCANNCDPCKYTCCWLTDLNDPSCPNDRQAIYEAIVIWDNWKKDKTKDKPSYSLIRSAMDLVLKKSSYDFACRDKFIDRIESVYNDSVPMNDANSILKYLGIRKQCLEWAMYIAICSGGNSINYHAANSQIVSNLKDIRPGMGLYNNKGKNKHAMIIIDVYWKDGVPTKVRVAESNYDNKWNNPIGQVPWNRSIGLKREVSLNLGYSIIDYSKNCNGENNNSLDVVIAFDRSGSMTATMMNAAKFAVKTFIDCLNKSKDRIGLVSFSTTATLDCSLIQSADLKSIVDKYTADGTTNMGAALNLAITELNVNGRSGAFRVIIYFTDGQSNKGLSKAQILSTVSSSGIKVYTIGYGSGVDSTFLTQVANESGGKYFYAPNSATIKQIYLQLSQISAGWISKSSFSGIINPGETITVGTVNIPWGLSFWKFLLSWPGSDLDLILIDPNGIQVLSGENVIFSGDTNPEFYDIQNPIPGIWTIKVFGKILTGPEEYNVEVFEHGAVLEADPSVTDVYGNFSVDIKVNTYSEAINSVKAYLNFLPDNFEVVNIDYSHSFLTSWIEQVYDNINGTINLQGSLPDPGFKGIGLIASVTLRPKILGRGNLSFDSSCFVLRNGDDLDILSTTINGSYNYSILLISPLDMSTIYTVSPTFQWTNISGADLYQLNIENLSGLVYDNNLISSNTLALPTGLFFNNNTYFWKVRAHDVNGWSDWSDVWSFNVTTQLTIDSSAEAGGTILPLGGVLVDYGDSKEFTIIADPMFLINKVLIDGSAVPISHPKIMVYKFTNITTNHTISAEFIHSSPILDLSIETNKTTFKQGDDILYKVYIYNTGNADSTDTTFNVNFPFEIKYDKTDKYFASVQPNGEVMINIGNVTPGTHTFQINAHISTSITQEKSVTTIFDLKSKETDTLRKIINSLLTPNRTGSPGDAGTISVTFLNTKTDPETGERYIDQTNELEMQLGFYGFTSPCDIKINWGDGETETITKTKETLMICKHKYSAKGTMVIQITITDATGKTKTVTAKIKVR